MRATQWTRRLAGRAVDADMDEDLAREEGSSLGTALRALAPALPPPDSAFISALEQQLTGQHGAATAARDVHTRSRHSVVKRLAFGLTAVVIGLVFAAVLFMLREHSPLSPAQALAASYDALFSLDTLKYRAEGEVGSDRAIEWSTRDGAMGGCEGAGKHHVVYEGEYDIKQPAVRAVETITRLPGGHVCPGGPVSRESVQERLYVNGTLYMRNRSEASDDDWREAEIICPSGCERTALTAISEVGGWPLDGLQGLRERYDIIATLPQERLDGVFVDHYQASKAFSDGGSITVEAWIGATDGLPRKTVVERREPLSKDILAERYANTLNTIGGPLGHERALVRPEDIVIKTDDIPSERYTRYVYTFWGFNEPVDIRAPETATSPS